MPKSRTQATQSPCSSRVLASLNRALSNQSLTKALAMSVEILREKFKSLRLGGNLSRARKRSGLGSYAGDEETEQVRIPIGEGICGSAAKEGATIVVPDVSKDPSYHMCFATTRSDRRPDKGKERSPRRDRYRQQSTIRLQPRRPRDS